MISLFRNLLLDPSNSSYPDYLYMYFVKPSITKKVLFKYKVIVFKNLKEQGNVYESNWSTLLTTSTDNLTIGSPFLYKSHVLNVENKYLDSNGSLRIRAEVSLLAFQ